MVSQSWKGPCGPPSRVGFLLQPRQSLEAIQPLSRHLQGWKPFDGISVIVRKVFPSDACLYLLPAALYFSSGGGKDSLLLDILAATEDSVQVPLNHLSLG